MGADGEQSSDLWWSPELMPGCSALICVQAAAMGSLTSQKKTSPPLRVVIADTSVAATALRLQACRWR